MKTKQERAIDAEHKAARWLAKGRAAEEQGDRAKAERHFERAEKWLTKANQLRGWA
jgi:hypothetical protein